jgi:putative restriction endonuclease
MNLYVVFQETTMPKFFGTPDHVHVGQQFVDRQELSSAYVHRPTQGGISGNAAEGADSIVVSGGYADDEDHGDYIIYTGHGGRAPNATTQTFDQSPTAAGNAGLITSRVQGFPVRVVRGADPKNPYAPPAGYVYAGLFEVTDYWPEIGLSGFIVMRYRLERISEQPALVTTAKPQLDPAYATTTVSRRIRDSEMSRQLKKMYGHSCQVCGTSIPAARARLYSEGAHVKPLGKPHLGADQLDNILCLCPNHHTQLDMGGMVILGDFSVASITDLSPFAQLTFKNKHILNAANAKYQREFWLTIQNEK